MTLRWRVRYRSSSGREVIGGWNEGQCDFALLKKAGLWPCAVETEHV